MHIIQTFIYLNPHLHRCPYHPAKKLGDIGGILGVTKGHHGFRSGTIPAGGKAFFEEDQLDFPIVIDAGRLIIRHFQTVYINGFFLAKSVYNFALFKTIAGSTFNRAQGFIEICLGDFIGSGIFHLNDKNRIDVSIVLLIAILLPVSPFLSPLVGCRLQDGHIFSNCCFLRIGNDNAVFQKSGSSHFIRCYDDLVNGGGRALYERVEAFRRCRHADDDRHRLQSILRASFQEFLHDSSRPACFTP